MSNSRDNQKSSPEQSDGDEAAKKTSGTHLSKLTLTALGIVFGDIGTSPLYALRECFHGEYGIAVSSENVFGVLSLMFWSLIMIVTIKYLAFVVRADNNGEGGVLALTALLKRTRPKKQGQWFSLLAIGMFGACLLYGDGMITPAISVLERGGRYSNHYPRAQTVCDSCHHCNSRGIVSYSTPGHGKDRSPFWAHHFDMVFDSCCPRNDPDRV